jgi:hypothetical protein
MDLSGIPAYPGPLPIEDLIWGQSVPRPWSHFRLHRPGDPLRITCYRALTRNAVDLVGIVAIEDRVDVQTR